MNRLRCLCFVLILSPVFGQQQGVILWEGPMGDQKFRNLTYPLPGPGQCVEIPANFDNVLSAVQTSGCVRVYENAQCGGQMFEVQPPDDKGVMITAFDNKATSFGGCEIPTTPPAPPSPPASGGKGGTPKKKGGKGKKKFIKKVKKVTVIG